MQFSCPVHYFICSIILNAFDYVVITDNVDSSGMRFTLTRMPRQYNAGVSGLGAEVNSNLFVPPDTDPFNIYGYCPSACTSLVRKYINNINNLGIIVSFKLATEIVYKFWKTVNLIVITRQKIANNYVQQSTKVS